MTGKSKYNAYIEIEDNNGKRIKIDGVKFIENSSKRDISKKDVIRMKKNALKNKNTSLRLKKDNRQILHNLKNRK